MLELLRDSFDKDERAFIIGEENFFPTLDDVLCILGFPIDGKPITGNDYTPDDIEVMCEEFFGSHISGLFHGKELKLNVLYDKFTTVPENVSELDLDRHVVTYVLFVIGSTFLSTKDHDHVPEMYLDLL